MSHASAAQAQPLTAETPAVILDLNRIALYAINHQVIFLSLMPPPLIPPIPLPDLELKSLLNPTSDQNEESKKLTSQLTGAVIFTAPSSLPFCELQLFVTKQKLDQGLISINLRYLDATPEITEAEAGAGMG
ncbi:MAG: hypothetical protein NTV32_04030 [Gammaproteobacteria bacterium]|nr:hypothetical protein [Gammaproteobacteria bacterium]